MHRGIRRFAFGRLVSKSKAPKAKQQFPLALSGVLYGPVAVCTTDSGTLPLNKRRAYSRFTSLREESLLVPEFSRAYVKLQFFRDCAVGRARKTPQDDTFELKPKIA